MHGSAKIMVVLYFLFIQLFNLTKVGRHTRRYLWKTFSCTAALDLFAIARYSFWTDSWYNYSLGSTDPNNACGQVNSVTRNLAAIVPTCILGQSTDCSLKEKANNLGKAKYRVFITWDDYNCSGSELTACGKSNIDCDEMMIVQ